MKPNQTLAILFVLGVFFVFAVAPIIEITLKDKEGNVLSHSTQMPIISSQSLVPVTPISFDKAEINILQQGKKAYYICEDQVPQSIAEVKEYCDFIGSDKP